MYSIGGIQILDVGDPAQPKLVDGQQTGMVQQVHVVGNLVYAAVGLRGLMIWRHTPSIVADIPLSGGVLTSASDSTSYDFLPNTFSATVEITHTPYDLAPHPQPVALRSIGHFFDVTAVYTSSGALAEPTRPFTLTVQYADADPGPAIESTLALYFWDGARWVKEPSSAASTATNTIAATPDHFSQWAVFGETRRIFLPVGLKR
jgi:hypothetical protein